MNQDDIRLIADCEERCERNDHAIVPSYLRPLLELTKRLIKKQHRSAAEAAR